MNTNDTQRGQGDWEGLKLFFRVIKSSTVFLARRAWAFLVRRWKNENFLIKGITTTILLAILVSIFLSFTSNKVYLLDSKAIWQDNYTNRFIAKHDTLRVWEAISRIHDGIKVEESFMQQAYEAYLAMEGKRFISIAPSINSPEKYLGMLSAESIERANDVVSFSVEYSHTWRKLYDRLFWFWVVIQFLNLIFVVRLLQLSRIRELEKLRP